MMAFAVLFTLIPITGLAFGESIPKCAKNIFVWYAEDKVEESELLKAIQYLINSKIIITSEGNQITINYIASIEAHR